jgi:hypothetical protein
VSAIVDELKHEESKRLLLGWLSLSELKSLREVVVEHAPPWEAEVSRPFLLVAVLRRALDLRADCTDHLAAMVGPTSLSWRGMRPDCSCVSRLLFRGSFVAHLERSVGPAEGHREAWLEAIRLVSARVHVRADARRAPAGVADRSHDVVVVDEQAAPYHDVLEAESHDATPGQSPVPSPAADFVPLPQAATLTGREWVSKASRDRADLTEGIADRVF